MKASFAASLLVLALGGSAYAQGQSPAATPAMDFMQACSADVQKLCPSAQTHKDQKTCVKQNKPQLSPSCRSFLAARHEEKMQEKQQGAASAQTPPAGGNTH